MPYKEGQPPLMIFLGEAIVPIAVRKPLFREPFVPLSNLCATLSFFYESAAILGRARRNKLETLEKVLLSSVQIMQMTDGDCLYLPRFEAGTEQIELLQKLAKNRLDKFRKEVGEEPATFFEFILLREFQRRTWPKEGGPYPVKLSKESKRLQQGKIPLIMAVTDVQAFGLEGIGFGGSFPELTEKMYRNAYEGVHTDLWAEARAHGIVMPKKPEMVSFEEREETILQMVASYVAEYYPDLLEPLDLRYCR